MKERNGKYFPCGKIADGAIEYSEQAQLNTTIFFYGTISGLEGMQFMLFLALVNNKLHDLPVRRKRKVSDGPSRECNYDMRCRGS